MSYLNRNRLKNFFINLKKYFKSEEFLNSMAISNAEIDNIANTAGYNDNGTGTVNYDFVPRSGGAVLSGTDFFKSTNTSYLMFCAGNAWNNGGGVALYGKDASTFAGGVTLKANDGTNYATLDIYPNGTTTLNNNGTTKNVAMAEDVIPRSGGAVINGPLMQSVDNSTLTLRGGSGVYDGAGLILFGKNASSAAGYVEFIPRVSSTVGKDMQLKPDGTWTWNGTAVQITSDQRLKQQINAIDDKLLDAWKDVAPVQFKYNDSVNEKGDNARLHTGYVVQQIAEACQNNDVDISEYGLYCHEVYPEKTEEVTIENEDRTTSKETKVVEEASEHYSLRYTEALIVECAFLRREVERLTERVTNLESRRKRTTS